MSNEIEMRKGIFFSQETLESMEAAENYEPTPEELKKEQENQKKLEEKDKQERLQKSGIGERYYRVTLDSFVCQTQEQNNVLEKVKHFINNYQEKTLWMVGKPGTGKTMLAAIICRECLHAHYVKSYQIELELDDCKSFKATKSKTEIIKNYSDYPVLVIDEIGKFESKEEIKYLFMIINERYEKNKSTVLISNKSKKELIEYLGQPVYDRFTENCMSIEFDFESYRINMRR